MAADTSYNPKASVYDELGMRLKNLLKQQKQSEPKSKCS